MIYAKQSTAIICTVGPVLDAVGVAVTDGVVGDFKISKNGGAPAGLNASATLTHRSVGFYSLSLTATDVNTVGTAEVMIDDTTNTCPMKEITVVEGTTYDVLFADSAPGPASPTNITAGTVTTATNVTTVNGLAANVITAAATAADFGTEVAAAVWDMDATAHQTQGTFGQAIGDPAADTNTIFKAVVTDATGVTVGADVVALKAETVTILADTNELQTDWANGGRLDVILDARSSQTSVDDLPTNAELATALDPLPTAAENATAVLTTAMTESYAADGAAPTLAQSVFHLLGREYEFAISGDTLTVKKLDGATTAMTFTLSPAGGPYTGITRAS